MSINLFAQTLPPICVAPERMTPTCAEACLICDINGFTGRNTSAVPGELPNGFCTTQKHNGQWIGFMAGTADLVIDIDVSKCNGTDGLEIGIFEGIDCKNYKLVSNCDTDVQPNSTVRLTMTTKLKVGQHYYLVIDGNRGDMCDYKVRVISGSTKVNPLQNSGIINGPSNLCVDDIANLSVSDVVGAIKYEWKVNGTLLALGQSANWSASKPGTYQICVQASNACDIAPPTCHTIEVHDRSFTHLESMLCSGDCFKLRDTSFCQAGIYMVRYKNFYNCDSIIELVLQYQQAKTTSIMQRACIGDTIKLGGVAYTSTGIYSQNLMTSLGCDSTVTLNLNFIQCNINANTALSNVICFNQKNGSIRFIVTQGTAPFSYRVEYLNGALVSSGSNLSLNDTIAVNNLIAGTYAIYIKDNFGNEKIIYSTIDQPTQLRATGILSDFNGYNISCNGLTDGLISLNTIGGIQPFRYQWSNGTNDSTAMQLKEGNYSVTITDANNCPLELSFTLKSPPALAFNILAQDPDCDDRLSGKLSLQNIIGGNPPYLFSKNNEPFDTITRYNKLASGLYNFVIKDKNNCEVFKSVSLVDPEHIIVQAIKDYEIELGDSIALDLVYGGQLKNIQWIPKLYIECDTCEKNIVKPLTDIAYKLIVQSKDGCFDSIQFLIKVVKHRDVWAPNVFSPNSDQINDYFTLYGTKQIKAIRNLKIYSRWGELLYHNPSMEANNPYIGWNGMFRGQHVNPGVYTWIAQVVFYDDELIELSGDITLIR